MFEKLYEWVFSHEKVKTSKEIEPETKELKEPKTTQIADDLPIGFYAACVDSYGIGKNKTTDQEEIIKSLITRYRKMELVAEVDDAVDTIINEMIVPDEDSNVNVEIDLKMCELADSIKTKITESFKKILNLLNFNKDSYDIVRKWYVDGRIYFNIVVEEEKLNKGIKKLIYIDALDIFLNRKIITQNKYNYFYKYIDRDENKTYEVHTDLIAYAGSNKFDRIDGVNPVEISYLHRAFKPFNNLKNIEDSIVIYRLIRATEKRRFTVNTGMLNKTAAEEYMQKLINKFKNRLIYNSETGEVNVYKLNHSMIEDFWFAENAQGKGIKVDILEGGKGLTELDDLYYFKDAFYDSLKIPESRRNLDRERERAMFSTSSEISRDEIIFFKMIQRLRKQFSQLFIEFLKRDLIWTKILNKQEFDKIKNSINFIYNNDNMYEEIKQSTVLNNRLNNLILIQPYIGKYFTNDEIAYNILKFTEEEWKEKQKDFKKNKKIYDKMMYGDEQLPFNSGDNFNKNKEKSPLVTDVDNEEEKKENEDEMST